MATAAAGELPRLSVADALSLLLLYRDADRPRFERGVVRWHALLCLEVRTLSPADAQLALAALNALGDGESLPAATALRELLARRGQREAAAALERDSLVPPPGLDDPGARREPGSIVRPRFTCAPLALSRSWGSEPLIASGHGFCGSSTAGASV